MKRSITKSTRPSAKRSCRSGEIKKISIAVLVDGIYQKNDKGVATYQERPKKELESFEDLVRKSSGFNAQRGDQVVVSSMPFNRPESERGNDGTVMAGQYRTGRPDDQIRRDHDRIAAHVSLYHPTAYPECDHDRASASRETEQTQIRFGRRCFRLPWAGIRRNWPCRSLTTNRMSEMELAKQLAGADSKKFAELLRNWLK